MTDALSDLTPEGTNELPSAVAQVPEETCHVRAYKATQIVG